METSHSGLTVLNSPLHQCLRAARRRLVLRRVLDYLALSSCIASATALALLLSDRLLATHTPNALFIALAAVPPLLAVTLGLLNRPGDEDVAAIVDERLGLKNQLTSGLYAQTLPNDPFARRVLDDSQRAAQTARLSDAVPMRASRWWAGTALLLVVATFAFYLVPPADLLGLDARRRVAAEETSETAQAAEDVKQAAQAAEELRQNNTDALTKEAQESLNELAQLTRNDLSNPNLRREAEAQISKAEDKLEKAAEEKQQSLDAIQNSMSKLDSGQDGPADKFENAMRRGDYAEAAKAMQELARELDNLSKDEREQLASQIEEIAKQLEQAAEKFEKEQDQKKEDIEKELEKSGMKQEDIEQLKKELGDEPDEEKKDQEKKDEKKDEEKDEKKDEKKEGEQKPRPSKEQIEESLKKKGMDEEKAKDLADKLDKANKEKERAEEGKETARQLADSLKQASEECKNPGDNEGKQGNGPDGQSAQGNPGNKEGSKPGSGGESGTSSTQKKLEQLARMKESLNKMKQGSQQLREVMKKMGGNKGQGNGQQPQPIAGEGGDNWGTGSDPNVLGPDRKAMENVNAEAVGAPGEPKGKVITSWDPNGKMSKGEAKLTYDRAVTSAKDQADKAIEEDRVPIKYRQTIKDYFNQVPGNPEGVTSTPAPATN